MTAREERSERVVAEHDPLQAYIEAGLQRLKDRYSDVHAKLDLARVGLTEASSSEEYQAIGLLCRDAMIMFANAIFSPDFIPESEETPAEDRAMPRIEATLAHFGEMAGSEEQRRLARAVLAYAMRLHHNQEAAREEAQRALVFTTLVLTELAGLMEKATQGVQWVETYGRYKCPVCGSTELDEDEIVDYDADIGPILAARYLACGKCPWTSLGDRP